jgi:hypothetical protein
LVGVAADRERGGVQVQEEQVHRGARVQSRGFHQRRDLNGSHRRAVRCALHLGADDRNLNAFQEQAKVKGLSVGSLHQEKPKYEKPGD